MKTFTKPHYPDELFPKKFVWSSIQEFQEKFEYFSNIMTPELREECREYALEHFGYEKGLKKIEEIFEEVSD